MKVIKGESHNDRKTKDLRPEGIGVHQLKIEQNYQKIPNEPELQVSLKVHSRENGIYVFLFETNFCFGFRIQIEITASYSDASLSDFDEEEILKLVVTNSYPIYAKTFLILGFLLDQMGYAPFYIPYSRFIKLTGKSDE